MPSEQASGVQRPGPGSRVRARVQDPGAADAGNPTVVTLGEHALIARIRHRLGPAPDWLVVDVGDDAAVYEPVRNRLEVITTDAIVDGVHFDRRFVPAEAIGHRAVAVNLSDLAAMGATPRLLTLSLALPDDVSLDDFDRLVDGAIGLAERAGARVVGGNITRTPGPLIVDVTAVGSVHRRRILRRSGARAGDYVFVSGTLGDARAGLALLADPGGADRRYAGPRSWHATCSPSPGYGSARRWDSRARPRRPWISATGWPMGWRGSRRTTGSAARSMQPRCRSRRVPRAVWHARGADAVVEAVAGGDDYELAFTVRPKEARRSESGRARVRRLADHADRRRDQGRRVLAGGCRAATDADRPGIRTLQPLMLAHSLWRKLALTIIVGGGVVWLYEVTVLDSRFAAVQSADDPAPAFAPAPGCSSAPPPTARAPLPPLASTCDPASRPRTLTCCLSARSCRSTRPAPATTASTP